MGILMPVILLGIVGVGGWWLWNNKDSLLSMLPQPAAATTTPTDVATGSPIDDYTSEECCECKSEGTKFSCRAYGGAYKKYKAADLTEALDKCQNKECDATPEDTQITPKKNMRKAEKSSNKAVKMMEKYTKSGGIVEQALKNKADAIKAGNIYKGDGNPNAPHGPQYNVFHSHSSSHFVYTSDIMRSPYKIYRGRMSL